MPYAFTLTCTGKEGENVWSLVWHIDAQLNDVMYYFFLKI